MMLSTYTKIAKQMTKTCLGAAVLIFRWNETSMRFTRHKNGRGVAIKELIFVSMHVLEEKTAFSKSMMWQLQRRYYEEEGIEAWRTGEVPHYVTSNPVMGKTYAELVLALLRDLALKGQGDEKVYLLELGAGHGRLCYHFFKHFEKYYESSALALPPFCYVLSDFTSANLDFWKGQEQLQAYVKKGWLDYCLFDAEKTETVHLQHSGTCIETGGLKQPLVVVGNYFFDSLPQDLFLVGDGILSTGHLKLYTEKPPEQMVTAELIDDLQFEFSYELAERPFYEHSPAQNAVLEFYVAQLEGSHLLFPHVGLSCLERLAGLSEQGVFLLTADKGEQNWHELDGAEEPIPVTHGSLSLLVNYHAFAQYAKQRGGVAWFPSQQVFSILLGCLFIGNTGDFPETRLAYERYVIDYGPDDFFSLKKRLENEMEQLELNEILSSLCLGAYDSRLFSILLPRMLQLADDMDDRERQSLFLIIPRIWGTHFHLGENHDLALDIGTLLLELVYYQEAVLYFEESLKLYGEQAEVLYKLALCHCLSEAFHLASPYILQLKKTNPDSALLEKLYATFEGELKL